jgi:pimeloyl-ACP methyl ester carboxylesterase
MSPIILLHGALGVSGDLSPLAGALKKKKYETHLFSFSGHGGSAFKEHFGIEQFAEELENYLDANGLHKADLFGYSMGGFVALYLASRQPGKTGRIMTLGTKFNWSKESVEKETGLLNPALMLEKVPAFARDLENKHGAGWKILVERTAGMMREIGEKHLLDPATISSISVPVWLGLADRDQMVSLEETTALFKQLPKASMYMLPDSKHPIGSADPDLLANLIVHFSDRVDLNT